ncbi:hypothetical protein M440DRAFT_1345063, partial [Trichoderma longibrachiatum ATCC 18648]
YYFIYKKVKRGEVKLKYIPINKIVANRLTKLLGKDCFIKFYKALGLRKLTNIEIASKEV